MYCDYKMVTYKEAIGFVILDSRYKTDRIRPDGENFIASYSIYDDEYSKNRKKMSERDVMKVVRSEEKEQGRKVRLVYRKTMRGV